MKEFKKVKQIVYEFSTWLFLFHMFGSHVSVGLEIV